MRRERTFLLFGLRPDQYSWRGVSWLAVFYVGAIIFGAIVGPALFLAQQGWHEASPNGFTTYLQEKDFEQFFDRARELFALLCLPVFFAVCGFLPYSKARRLIPSAGKLKAALVAIVAGFHRIGLGCAKRDWATFGRNFAFGAVLAGIIVIGQLCFSPTNLKPELSAGSVIGALLGALAGGVAVSFLEETLFRGVIFRCFYSVTRPVLAIVLTSAFFAYAHFKHPDALFADANTAADMQAGWSMAFWTLFGIFKSFQWLPFLNLFMFGNLLCLVFVRSRSLMSPAGLHAGAVFIMLAYSKNFQIHGGSQAREIWGGAGIVDGMVPLAILTVLVIFLAIRKRA